MAKKLWEASKDRKLNSNLYDYEKFISKKYNLKFNQKYSSLLKWSIQNPGNFWGSIWDYCKIKGFKKCIAKEKYLMNRMRCFVKVLNVFLKNMWCLFIKNGKRKVLYQEIFG